MCLLPRAFLVFILFSLSALPKSTASNILFMGPFPAPSHWLWLEHFQKALLDRGHHVTSVNNHPAKEQHPNLTEIIIDPPFDIPYYFPKDSVFKMRFPGDLETLQMWWQIGVMTSEHVLNDPKVKALIASKDLHFDLLILEQFFHESFLMFAHKFGCPIATLGTMGYADNMDHAMGLVTPWSIIPHLILPSTDRMTFTERAYNVYLSLYDNVMRRWFYLPQMQEMAERHFGEVLDHRVPSVRDLHNNISLMLINSHRSMDIPRPSMPGLVNVGGVHIKPAKPLPQDLQTFLDGSTNGVVYFSLGSYMKSTDMPIEKVSMFLHAFSKLQQNVLWKYENESVAHLPDNVMIRKWLPQNDVLAHPNVKLFMTHGGIFGTQEAVHWGVPMLCLPLYGDQYRNSLKSVKAGLARMLSFSDMSSEDLSHNINAIIADVRYKQNALEMSQKFRDNLMHPMDEAMYWLEYVIRYHGANHLKSYGAFIPLHQYLLLDVLACGILVLLAMLWLPWMLIRMARKYLRQNEEDQLLQKKML